MGDPMLHPDWDVINRYASDQGLKTAIFTNGSLFTEKNITRLFNARVSVLVISYMGMMYNSDRSGKPGFFDRGVYDDRIRKLLERKAALLSRGEGHLPRIEMHIFHTRDLAKFNRTVDVKPENEIKDLFLDWIEFGRILHEKYQLPVFENDPQKFNGFLDRPMYESNFHVMDEVSVVPKHVGTFANTIVDDAVTAAAKGECDMYLKQMGVLSNGEVTFCCFDYEGKLSVGNIDSHNLKELWNNPTARKYREAFLNNELVDPYCQQCKGTVNGS
jgi:radical SAM protein with 4Fe4S-binding SPASM domain